MVSSRRVSRLLLLLTIVFAGAAGACKLTGGSAPEMPDISTSVAKAFTATAEVSPPPRVTSAGPPAHVAAPTTLPTVTSTPTDFPTLPPTDTPTPQPTPHPMSIPGMRAREYPGSDIALVEVLDPGVNYARYYASYESDGLTIYGLLTVPNDGPPEGGWPAIVFNHGYIPPNVYRTTERYVAYLDWLARSGYVVYRIDYRGHDRSEGEARGAYSDPGYTIDVLNAVGSLKRLPYVDPRRIGMWGHSMGGYLTLRAMVIAPDIRAGVIWAGVVGSYPDLMERWRRSGSETSTPVPAGPRRWRSLWLEEFGSPEENPNFWDSISANTFVADISGPIQLHHGTADESVPAVLSEILFEQMQAAGKPVELYTYKDDNHNLNGSFSTAMTRTLRFFEKYLKGTP